jgi:hypothetical protein
MILLISCIQNSSMTQMENSLVETNNTSESATASSGTTHHILRSTKGKVILASVLLILVTLGGISAYVVVSKDKNSIKVTENTTTATPTPTILPTLSPTVSVSPTQGTIVTKMYSNTKFPGFNFDYPSSWTLSTKEFDTEDTDKSYPSLYFGENRCAENCMGITLEKDGVRLVYIMEIVFDDSGSLICSNTFPFEKLQANWTRYKAKNRYVYTNTATFNYLADSDDMGQRSTIWEELGWSNASEGVTYKLCDIGFKGTMLEQKSTIELPHGGLASILFEKPQLFAEQEVSTDVMKEADQIVASVKGLRKD